MNPSHDIAVFIRVVDLGSFAAVAKEANLSPSAVSKIVSRLEDRLGVKLLQRTTRRLVLSQEGETYSIRGREILAAIEAAELSVIDRRVDVVAEQIDVAIRVGPLHDTSLVCHRLGEVRRIIAASPAYLRRHGRPRHARDLLSHNCLHLSGFSRLAGWPMYIDGERVLLPVKGSVSSDSAEMLLDLAVAGIGIIRLGDFLGEAALSAKQLVPLLENCHDDDPTPLSALMPPGRQNIPRVRAFVDFLDGKLKTASKRSATG
jgi:DNA-binding transcriptional LysR family regulator